MPISKKDLQTFRTRVEGVNARAHSNLSYNKILSDVKKIMSNPEQTWPDLFVEYLKVLHKEINKSVSYHRTLIASDNSWLDQYIETFGRYGAVEATEEAKALLSQCRKMIDPEAAARFEFKPEQLKAIRDWHLEEAKQHTEYVEAVRILKSWTQKNVDSAISFAEGRLGLTGGDPAKIHTFSGERRVGNDTIVCDVYSRMHVFREELSKHGRLWRWFFSKRVDMYNSYIDRAKQLLEKVGFDEEKHGPAVIEYSKTHLLSPYSVDIDSVKTDYDTEMQRYTARHMPEIHDARDHQEWAAELNLDPESSVESKLLPYAEKYGMDVSRFSKVQIDWKSIATSYDKVRETEDFDSTLERMFITCFNRMIESEAEKKGGNVNVAEVLKDARDIAVIVTNFNSIAYSLDTFKNAEKPAYLKNVDHEYIRKRMSFYLKDVAMPDEEKEKLANAAADVIKEWEADPAKLKKEDEALAVKNAPAERTLFSPFEAKIANSLMTIGYRPPSKDDPKMIEKHAAVLEKLVTNHFLGDDKGDGAKSIVAANSRKITGIKKLVFEKYGNEEHLKEWWSEDDLKLQAKFPNYQPKTLAELEADDKVRAPFRVEINDEKQQEKSEPVNQNGAPSLSTGSVVK